MVAVPCSVSDPLDCGEKIVGGLAGEAAGDVFTSTALTAWEAVCRSFADAAVALLEGFAKAFVAFRRSICSRRRSALRTG